MASVAISDDLKHNFQKYCVDKRMQMKSVINKLVTQYLNGKTKLE